MSFPRLQDTDSESVDLLRQIRDAVRGIDGESLGRGQTAIRVHDLGGDFAPPQETVNIANQRWESHRLESMELDDLEPGDEQTIVEMESDQNELFVAVRGVATSEHAYDLQGDGELQSAVVYRHQYKTHDGDGWRNFPGIGGTLPLGVLGDPVEILPGAYIGPMAGYRIQFINRSEHHENEVTIPAEKMGAQIAGIAITGGSDG